MAQNELFKRYLWLADLIYRKDGITRTEINRCWSRSCLNNSKENEIPERTFHRHKIAIEELFDIQIVCNRHGDKTYHIANRDAIQKDGVVEWLLNSFAVNNLLNESKALRNRILFESVSPCQQYLVHIIEAMREDKVINLSYQSFHMDEAKPHEVEPYCLKIYKQRWYLIGRRPDRDVVRTFALDRVMGLEITDAKFILPESFDAEKYFEDTIGIIIENNCPAQTITIHALNGQQDYIRSLPLHPTQKEYDTQDGEAKFCIYAQPNHDLIRELLKYGEDVIVLQPKWFRDKFQQISNRMCHNYNEE